jgi:aminopeptidase S
VGVAEPLRLRAAVVATAVFLAACSVAQPAATSRGSSPIPSPGTAAPSPTERATADALTAERVSEAISAAALSEHLTALQAIADAHGASRATGTPGFDASAAYVETALGAAGYVVERHSFDAAGTPSSSLVVERPGDNGEVVMLGAHLDSVVAGPGINDNGSGVAALLVIAERLAELPAPRRTVRFAFWGAEEGGPFGSTAYVAALEPAEHRDIVAYLNFDMIGSPNAIRLVYDEAGAAPGSAALTRLFATALGSAGLAWEPIDLEGDSDHGPFIEAGIPTGGLFSGGIEPVTDAQAASFGAIAGEPADACSHHACDTIDNVDLATLEEMADAIAAVLVMLAVQES